MKVTEIMEEEYKKTFKQQQMMKSRNVKHVNIHLAFLLSAFAYFQAEHCNTPWPQPVLLSAHPLPWNAAGKCQASFAPNTAWIHFAWLLPKYQVAMEYNIKQCNHPPQTKWLHDIPLFPHLPCAAPASPTHSYSQGNCFSSSLGVKHIDL